MKLQRIKKELATYLPEGEVAPRIHKLAYLLTAIKIYQDKSINICMDTAAPLQRWSQTCLNGKESCKEQVVKRGKYDGRL